MNRRRPVVRGGKPRRAPAWRRLVGLVGSGPEREAHEAGRALARCRSGGIPAALAALMLDRRVPARNAQEAAHVLAWRDDRRMAPAFVACVEDQALPGPVRGMAAEALGMMFGCAAARKRAWRAAEGALLAALDDPVATVRFWSCYALGEMRSVRAVAALGRLRDGDEGCAPGWWYVHEEAADALARIAGRPGEERVPVHLRTDGESPRAG